MKKAKRKTVGRELIEGLKEAIAYERGKKTLRTSSVTVPPPAKEWTRVGIISLRKETFEMSQAVFASLLNVSPATVRSWEQGAKTPSAPVRRLLEVAEADPTVFERIAEAKRG